MTEKTLTDEEFWNEFRNYLFDEEKLEKAEEEIENIMELADIQNGKALDIPCGVGRHSIELHKRGFEVVGVDKTKSYVEEAREKTERDIKFVNEDMKEFRREEEFDAAFNLWNSFGYFETREEDRQMLENIFESLKDGGKLVMEMWSKELTALNSMHKLWHEQDGSYFLTDPEITENFRKVEWDWIKIEDGEVKKYEWSQRLYAASELEDMLEDIGFTEIEIYGSIEGTDFDKDAEGLVIVAEK